MDQYKKIEYLQNTIQYNFKRREMENNSPLLIENSQTFSFGENSQNRRKMSEECDSNEKTANTIDVNNFQLNEKIEVIEKCVNSLKQNRALISAQNQKQRLVTVFYELNDVIDRLKQ